MNYDEYLKQKSRIREEYQQIKDLIFKQEQKYDEGDNIRNQLYLTRVKLTNAQASLEFRLQKEFDESQNKE